MGAGGAVVGTASVAGLQWANHLAEITEVLATDDWDAVAAFVDGRDDLVRDTYAFSKKGVRAGLHDAGVVVGGLAHGVRINSVCPGIIETPLITDFAATLGLPIMQWMTDQGAGRRATPDEIAGVLQFLGLARLELHERLRTSSPTAASTPLSPPGQADFTTLPA